MMSANLQQHLTLVFRIDFMATGIFLKEEFSRKRRRNGVKPYLNNHYYFIHFIFHGIFLFHFQVLLWMFHRNLVERLLDENKNAQSENILLHYGGEMIPFELEEKSESLFKKIYYVTSFLLQHGRK